MNAKEFIELMDSKYGESWSNSTEELAEAMEEYASQAMEGGDKFKNSPIHDKKAILNIMDELQPEQMIEVVKCIKQFTTKD